MFRFYPKIQTGMSPQHGKLYPVCRTVIFRTSFRTFAKTQGNVMWCVCEARTSHHKLLFRGAQVLQKRLCCLIFTSFACTTAQRESPVFEVKLRKLYHELIVRFQGPKGGRQMLQKDSVHPTQPSPSKNFRFGFPLPKGERRGGKRPVRPLGLTGLLRGFAGTSVCRQRKASVSP